MKKSRPTIALLALLALLGGGVAVKMRAGSQAKLKRDGRDGLTESGHAAGSDSKRQRTEHGDAERLAMIRGWLAETNDKEGLDRKRWQEMQATVNGLSLEAIKGLLADPDGLADEITGYIDDAFPIHAYPLRFEVRISLWQRFAELAPDEALARAFPDGKPVKDNHIQIEDILLGVAKGDPGRAFEAWQSHYSQSDTFENMTRMNVSSLATELTEACAKGDPAAVAARLGELGKDMRHYAYQGYAGALGEGTDWAAEITRFQGFFPDPEQQRFQSQNPTCSLITSWAKSNPAAAFDWMESLEKHEDATYTVMGYREVIAAWMREQPTASVEFLKNRDFPVAQQDDLYIGALSGFGGDFPEVVHGTLELIEDPERRDSAAMKLIERGYAADEVLRGLETSKRVSNKVREAAAAALAARAKPKVAGVDH